MSQSNAREMAFAAREKVQGMWMTLRSMTADEDGSISKLKKAMSTSDNNVQSTLDNLMKAMFGSCAVGAPDQPPVSLSSRTRSTELSEPVSPSREKEEFFYSQFLAPTRVAKAVSSVREQADARPVDHQRVAENKPSLTKPFPVSSPARRDVAEQSPRMVQEIVAAPPAVHAAPDMTGAGTMSFDDGISCLSAHTLEEMARHEDLARGRQLRAVPSDLTSEGFETMEVSHQEQREQGFRFKTFASNRINEENAVVGPAIDLTHGNSRTTHSTKRSNGTRSTQTSSFENAWRIDEQRYWEEVVQHEDTDRGTPERRREIMLQRVKALKERSGTPTSASKSPMHQESVRGSLWLRIAPC